MNFLSPWFLLGGLAIAGPIIFHLIRRAARERMFFSSLMFLRSTPPKMTRRRRIEHLWLLLLRCLALILLAAGFARPFFVSHPVDPDAASQGRQLVLLMDTSASMRRADLWASAIRIAASRIDETTLADQVSIMTFDRQPRTLVTFSEWASWPPNERRALAKQRLNTVSPQWYGTQLGLALATAAERLFDQANAGAPAFRRDVIVVSDLQEGANLEGLQGRDWPANTRVELEPVETHTANAGIAVLDSTPAPGAAEQKLQVRIVNSRDSDREKFTLNWTSQDGSRTAGTPMEIYLPPGQARTFSAPPLPEGVASARIQLHGDAEEFDNTAGYIRPETETVKIAALGTGPVNDPTGLQYYLQRVFPETPRRRIEFVTPSDANPYSPASFQGAQLAVVAGNLAGPQTVDLREWVSQGNSALLVLTNASMASTLAGLSGIPEARLTESSGNFALLGDINFQHPLFAPFADPRFSDFTQIHFWGHRRWDIPADLPVRVLAKFDDDSAALIELPVGKGRLLVLASGWNPADSQLAVSSKFPPLMQTLLEWSGSGTAVRQQLLTGDSIPSPASPRNATVQWRKPDGATVTLPSGTSFAETAQPGIYSASVAGRDWRFAVDLPLDESRTAPVSSDALAQLGVPLDANPPQALAKAQQDQRYLRYAEIESRQKFWRWLLLAVLVVTLGEILLGGWLARRIKPVEAVA